MIHDKLANCPICLGTGKVYGAIPCESCDGKGKVDAYAAHLLRLEVQKWEREFGVEWTNGKPKQGTDNHDRR